MRVRRLAGCEGGEFGGDRLAEHEAAGAAQQRDQGGIGLGPVAGIDRGAVLGRKVGGVENILDPDREPAQRLEPG